MKWCLINLLYFTNQNKKSEKCEDDMYSLNTRLGIRRFSSPWKCVAWRPVEPPTQHSFGQVSGGVPSCQLLLAGGGGVAPHGMARDGNGDFSDGE
jgi:hypothetical protein